MVQGKMIVIQNVDNRNNNTSLKGLGGIQCDIWKWSKFFFKGQCV